MSNFFNLILNFSKNISYFIQNNKIKNKLFYYFNIFNKFSNIIKKKSDQNNKQNKFSKLNQKLINKFKTIN